MYDIDIYEDKNGKSKSKDDKINSNKIRTYINLLAENGFELKEPFIKKIDTEIWELRPISHRILFAGVYNNKFILLSMFIKKTQKTPKAEIDKAKRYLEDYKKRSMENE